MKSIRIALGCFLLIILYIFLASENTACCQKVTLKFTSIKGQEVNTESLKGKIVLIDCWATWCQPCLNEMPRIKALYEKYYDKGFEVIGIPLDDLTSKDSVEQTIKKMSIPWPQCFEGKGFQEESFRKQYQLRSLPTVYLLDKEGKIVGANTRGERLDPLIKEHLGL